MLDVLFFDSASGSAPNVTNISETLYPLIPASLQVSFNRLFV